MKDLLILLTLASVAAGCASAPETEEIAVNTSDASDQYDVAAIVWPAYHPAPRWKELGIFKHGNGEWQNVYEAKTKFDGHREPLTPLWGYESEANPISVARKIDAALAAGINVFVYDWYWYGGRPFLEDALNNGFLKAPNNERMKFFLMWANHDVNKLWDNKVGGDAKWEKIWSAAVSYDEFTEKLVPRFIEYFKKPNYYKIDNKPVFSLYLPNDFIKGVGGMEKAKQALDFFRAEAKKAGFAGVHIQTMVTPVWAWRKPIAVPGQEKSAFPEMFKYLGIDSATVYNWPSLSKIEKGKQYKTWGEESLAMFDKMRPLYGVAYVPNVTIGWDNNSRFPKEQITTVIENSNPTDYEHFLRETKKWLDKNPQDGMPKLLIINSWNEWTEGTQLEPDDKNGYDFLNATARVFGGSGQAIEK